MVNYFLGCIKILRLGHVKHFNLFIIFRFHFVHFFDFLHEIVIFLLCLLFRLNELSLFQFQFVSYLHKLSFLISYEFFLGIRPLFKFLNLV